MKLDRLIARSTLLLQAVLLFPSQLNAQDRMSDHIRVDTIISLTREISNTYTDVVYARHGRKVLFTCYEAKRHVDTVSLFLVDVDSLTCKRLMLNVPGIGRHLQERRYKGLRCIAFDAQHVFVAFADRLLQCRYADGLKLEVGKETTIEQPFDEMYLLNEHLLVFSHCYPSYNEGKSSVHLFTFDIPTFKVQRTIIPDYNTVLMAPIKPFKKMDAKEGKVLWANRNEYSFTIYDSQLEKEGVVKEEELKFKGIPSKRINSISKKKLSGADLIEEIRPLIFAHDRIEYAYLIDEGNVAIVRVPRKIGQSLTKATLDWWNKQEGTWRRKYTDVEDWAYYEVPYTEPVRRNHLQIDWLSGASVVVFNDKILSIKTNAVPISPLGISRKDYHEWQEHWLLHHDTHMQIAIITHDFAQ